MLLAESKGISGSALIFRHALRNALIPIITVLAPLIVDLMTGSLVVEKIFAIPGVGSLLVNAIQSNDYNVVIALKLYLFRNVYCNYAGCRYSLRCDRPENPTCKERRLTSWKKAPQQKMFRQHTFL